MTDCSKARENYMEKNGKTKRYGKYIQNPVAKRLFDEK
jgi:hypothetical protein